MVYWKLYSCQVCPRPQAQYAPSSFQSYWQLKRLHRSPLSFCSHPEGTSPNAAVSTRYPHCLFFTFPAVKFLICETGYLELKKLLEWIREWNGWRWSPITGFYLAEVRLWDGLGGFGSSSKFSYTSWMYGVCKSQRFIDAFQERNWPLLCMSSTMHNIVFHKVLSSKNDVFIPDIIPFRCSVLDVPVFLAHPVLPTEVYDFIHRQFRIVFARNVHSIRIKRSTVHETGPNFYPRNGFMSFSLTTWDGTFIFYLITF